MKKPNGAQDDARASGDLPAPVAHRPPGVSLENADPATVKRVALVAAELERRRKVTGRKADSDSLDTGESNDSVDQVIGHLLTTRMLPDGASADVRVGAESRSQLFGSYKATAAAASSLGDTQAPEPSVVVNTTPDERTEPRALPAMGNGSIHDRRSVSLRALGIAIAASFGAGAVTMFVALHMLDRVHPALQSSNAAVETSLGSTAAIETQAAGHTSESPPPAMTSSAPSAANEAPPATSSRATLAPTDQHPPPRARIDKGPAASPTASAFRHGALFDDGSHDPTH